jgi:ribonuclease BN (tRNA processing enzyme)
LQVVFVGTGVCIVTSRRRSPSILVEIREEDVLLDAGPGTAQALAEMGYSTSEIRYILLTHLHLDHTNDYATLVNDRALTTREPLEVCGPRGLKRHSTLLFARLYPDLASALRCHDYLRIKEVNQGHVISGAGWRASCSPTEHAKGIAYRIDSENHSLMYSGDTEPCESLVQLGRNVDLAILECSFPDVATLKGKHLTPRTAAEMAARMNAKKLILTHMYPECEGRETEMLDNAKRIYDEEVMIASDGMKVVV